MDEKREFAANTLLLIAVLSLAAYLVYDVRYSNKELARIAETGIVDGEKYGSSTPDALDQETLDLGLFRDNNHFEDIVTPVPSETPPPQASPTPTEVPVLPDSSIIGIMSKVIQIKDKFGKNHFKKTGDEFEGHLIVEVDPEGRRVLVRNIQYGVEKWLPVQQKTPDEPRRPRTRRQ